MSRLRTTLTRIGTAIATSIGTNQTIVVDSVMPSYGVTELDGARRPHVTLRIQSGRRLFFFRMSGAKADILGQAIATATMQGYAEATGFDKTQRFKRKYGTAGQLLRERS